MCAIEQDQKQQQRQQQREHEVAVQGHTMFNKQKSESENERARMHAYCTVRTHCNMCGQSTHRYKHCDNNARKRQHPQNQQRHSKLIPIRHHTVALALTLTLHSKVAAFQVFVVL